jgi:tripartite ATP-independent transporter DctM subunit
MVVLPITEILLRNVLDTGIRGVTPVVQHLTLWVGFLGAAVSAREDMLLAFASKEFLPQGRIRQISLGFAGTVAALVSGLLCRAGIELVTVERDGGIMLTGIIPVWVAQLALPVAFGLIGLRLVTKIEGRAWRALAAAALIGGYVLGIQWEVLMDAPLWLGIGVVLLATLAGGPIFAALGGIAAFLFMRDWTTPAAVLVETYRLSVNPTLAALPLFTLVGFLLAEGNASGRLLRFFRAFFGFIPGGTALVCALICVFFTIPTGGSGVTILALGGLLFQALTADGYRERFSLGLLTGSGSLGLLFPPALPLILYGIVAQIPIEDLFIGGILPGTLLVVLVAIYGIRAGIKGNVKQTQFNGREALAALWGAKWELMVPMVALVAIFTGFATIVEAASLTVLYTFLTQTFIHRDLSLRKDLPRVLTKCIALIGGVLLILGVAMGFTSFMVDAQVPSNLLDWVQGNISSKIVFLLALNLFLLLVGCIMDIFSATVVVVPLIAPLAQAFGIHPVHLGIIFVANLELGYLTPPVGLNLFFASYRFERPLLIVYRAALPMLLILGIGVLLITYIPQLTTGLLSVFGGH